MRTVLGAVAALALAVGSSAHAGTPVTFTTVGNTNTSGPVNSTTDTHAYSATVGGTTYNMEASAFSYNVTTGKVETAFLGQYSYGLGVTSSSDGTGANNQHTVDNSGNIDFIMLQFDRPVDLVSASLYAGFPIGSKADNDATVSFANVNQSWKMALDLTDPALLATLSGNAWTVLGDGQTHGGSYVQTLNSDPSKLANVWLIGAAFNNADGITDSFKLNTIKIDIPNAAVPEPSTWAMMLGGFGMIGLGLRRRSPQRLVQAI